MKLYTIGHSTRSFDEFAALLREHAVRTVADIRRYPGSKRHPHFSREALERSLPDAGISYVHLVELGGRRKPHAGSPNTGWRSASFQAYADAMATPEFASAIERLIALPGPVAYMCAEAVPWRCHRNLVSDELVRRRIEVIHILGPGSIRPHEINPMAVDEGSHLIYPAPGSEQKALPLNTGSD